MRTIRSSSHLLGGGMSAQGFMPWGGVGVDVCPVKPRYEQNDRRLWKHNLAATTLLTVAILEVFP